MPLVCGCKGRKFFLSSKIFEDFFYPFVCWRPINLCRMPARHVFSCGAGHCLSGDCSYICGCVWGGWAAACGAFPAEPKIPGGISLPLHCSEENVSLQWRGWCCVVLFLLVLFPLLCHALLLSDRTFIWIRLQNQLIMRIQRIAESHSSKLLPSA